MEFIIFLLFIFIFFMKNKEKFQVKQSNKNSAAGSYRFHVPKGGNTEGAAAPIMTQNEIDERFGAGESGKHVTIGQLRAGEASDGMSALIEDRQHDWLARQLREEGRIRKRGESMLDLGAAHDISCDAREIKLLHMLQHDDSIDDGEL